MSDPKKKPIDPAERRRQKQASREADQRALRSGEKSPADLRRENSIVSRVRSMRIVVDGLH